MRAAAEEGYEPQAAPRAEPKRVERHGQPPRRAFLLGGNDGNK